MNTQQINREINREINKEHLSSSSLNVNAHIRVALKQADRQLIERYPWLGRDDLVVGVFFIGSLSLIALCSVMWMMGSLSAIFTICAITLALSVLHEMEHDLIHDLYLSHPIIRKVVFITIWFAKASIDPWTRRRLHIWHHAVSGQAEDIEERVIGLGLPWGPLRLLITLFPPAAIILKKEITRSVRNRAAEGGRVLNVHAPRGWWMVRSINGLLLSTPIIAVIGLFNDASWAWPLCVLWVLPNILRHTTIATMSSNSHYTDIQRGVLVEQNQILDHPMFWPFQIFCWNFGATHVVHHFFVRQPFWRRTLIFKSVRQLLIDHGVHVNDLKSFSRANQRRTDPIVDPVV